MNQEDITYRVETNKSFGDAVVAVLKAVDQKGWTVFQIIDIQERLSAKGFKHDALKIIEICSGKHANKLLLQNKLVSLCMPCKINVFVDNDKVFIAGMRPSVVAEFFDNVQQSDVDAIEAELKEMIDTAR
ncbi:DUF302 domain-containing protein [Candidatus Woesearchaeota archaeon]|nr:DUF302 domain-containing protein [Candidatus Woesearchaeota archaeon]